MNFERKGDMVEGGGYFFKLELAMTPVIKRIICAYGDSYVNQSKGNITFLISANDHLLSFPDSIDRYIYRKIFNVLLSIRYTYCN